MVVVQHLWGDIYYRQFKTKKINPPRFAFVFREILAQYFKHYTLYQKLKVLLYFTPSKIVKYICNNEV